MNWIEITLLIIYALGQWMVNIKNIRTQKEQQTKIDTLFSICLDNRMEQIFPPPQEIDDLTKKQVSEAFKNANFSESREKTITKINSKYRFFRKKINSHK